MIYEAWLACRLLVGPTPQGQSLNFVQDGDRGLIIGGSTRLR
jgi:hypothetical protein